MSDLIQSKDDFANLTTVPTVNQLNLKLVLEYYDAYIEPYHYTYITQNEEDIFLKFSQSNFPHLVGTHYAANAKYGKGSEKAKRFGGFSAYQEIEAGTIDKQTIKSIYPTEPKYYKDMTKKMRYFFNLHKVLESPEAVYYNKDKSKEKKNSKIKCDVLLYKFLHNQYIHVGLDKSGNKYVATTFLIESSPVFIDGQTPINIEKTEKVRHRKGSA